MRSISILSIALSVTLLFAISAGAEEQSLVETVANGCKAELDTYCKDVLPGEGRVLACLYAYSDKLSGKCEYALYDAAAQLEQAVDALAYVVNGGFSTKKWSRLRPANRFSVAERKTTPSFEPFRPVSSIPPWRMSHV